MRSELGLLLPATMPSPARSAHARVRPNSTTRVMGGIAPCNGISGVGYGKQTVSVGVHTWSRVRSADALLSHAAMAPCTRPEHAAARRSGPASSRERHSSAHAALRHVWAGANLLSLRR